MTDAFFKDPILNSPYEYPGRHWELDEGQPTQNIAEHRPGAEFITPIPKPRKHKKAANQKGMILDEGKGLSTREQECNRTSAVINQVRQHVYTCVGFPRASGKLLRTLLAFFTTGGIMSSSFPSRCQEVFEDAGRLATPKSQLRRWRL